MRWLFALLIVLLIGYDRTDVPTPAPCPCDLCVGEGSYERLP